MPILQNTLDEIRRGMARLAMLREQIKAIEQTRTERLEQAPRRLFFSLISSTRRIAGSLARWSIRLRKSWRSDQANGFVKLPKRWIVERLIAWLNRCRGLAKDRENLNHSASCSFVSRQFVSYCENSVIHRKLPAQTLTLKAAIQIWRITLLPPSV
jgi:transposase